MSLKKNCDQEQPSQKKAKVFSKKNHEERFGFAANEYDFDALENELLETNEEDLINPSAHINQLNSDAQNNEDVGKSSTDYFYTI